MAEAVPRGEGQAGDRENQKAKDRESAKLAISASFDHAFYLRQNPDVAAAHVDPLDHYLEHGEREGRRPVEWFDPHWYLQRYEDVARAGVRPFVHFVRHGRAEGRSPSAAAPRELFRQPSSGSSPPAALRRDPNSRLVTTKSLRESIELTPVQKDPKSVHFFKSRMNVHWVIPDFIQGGGGHMTIFRMVRLLELFGHTCFVWVVHAQNERDTMWRDIAIRHYQSFAAPIRPFSEFRADADVDALIATSWTTVRPVMAINNAKERFYFVQDFEPSFSPMGSEYVLAERTYLFDISCICAGTWLKSRMEGYGRWAASFELSHDADVYHAGGRPSLESKPLRIAFYARPSARRLVEIGYLALEKLAMDGVEFSVDLFGATVKLDAAPFDCVNHGVLGPESLARLYRECDVGLCLSATNPSLVPPEMMACGLPVVEADSEGNRSTYPAGVIALAAPEPSAIAEALRTLLSEPDRRAIQAEKAMSWVGQFSWERSARAVEDAVSGRLLELGFKAMESPVQAHPVASVIIPTFNGGDLLKRVLDQVRRQRVPWPFEVIVIDSSSTDGTREHVEELDGVRLEVIPQSEFAHGKTRNRAAAIAVGEFLCFLTQDALPTDTSWLYNLVTTLIQYPNAAGAFGRHVAYPDASPFTKRDMVQHFNEFLLAPLAMSQRVFDELALAGQAPAKSCLHFFSDNNSCLRRSVWAEIPFPDVAFAEDQVWAQRIIEAGYEKVFAPNAVVYHSHEFDAEQTFARAREEAFHFLRNFGYILIRSEQEMVQAIQARNKGDHEWGCATGIPPEIIDRQMRLNAARLRGLWAGGALSDDSGDPDA